MIFIAADSFPCLDRAQDDLGTHESGAGPRRGRRHVVAPAPQVVDQVGANFFQSYGDVILRLSRSRRVRALAQARRALTFSLT